MADFEIKRTITEADIPSQRWGKKSKWDGILKSMNTLKKDEGIEVVVPYGSVQTQLQKLAKKRLPRRHFIITGRKRPDGYYLYIIRKQ